MKKSFHTMIPVAALAWLVAGAASAAQPLQDAPPAAKPVQAEAAKTSDKAARQAKQAEQSTDEAVVQESKAAGKQGGAVRANREVLEPIAFEQARYMKRLAQLERIKEIAAEKNNDQLNQQAEALRIRNEEHHAARMADFRTKFGAEKVDVALAWIDKRVKERGNVGVVRAAKDSKKEGGPDGKTRQEAKEKKERTDEMKEKAKEKVKGETKP